MPVRLKLDHDELIFGVKTQNADIDHLHLGAVTARCSEGIAELVPREPRATPAGAPPTLLLVEAPTLDIWSTNDHYRDGERMKISGCLGRGH